MSSVHYKYTHIYTYIDLLLIFSIIIFHCYAPYCTVYDNVTFFHHEILFYAVVSVLYARRPGLRKR